MIKATAAALLAGLATALPAHAERGTHGTVQVLYWQAVSILNPYLSSGTKDVDAASLVLEPLARFDPTGTMVPWLAEEIPTLDNGGITADLRSITWQLRPDLHWSDGSAVTAEDVVFTWEYCTQPDGGCAQAPKFAGVTEVAALDDLTVRITYADAKPNPYLPFVGGESPILQRVQFADCLGSRAPQCTEQNFHPIGTGPFRVVEFRTNDVIRMAANPHYRDPAKPAFGELVLKGGGDAEGAARAVLQTGEVDYAWNLQLPPEVLEQFLAGGHGTAVSGFGTLVERIEVNLSDPSPDLPEGERATLKHPHPILSDPDVRKALSLAIDRPLLAEVGYGAAGRPICDIVPGPEHYAAGNTECLVQDLAAANQLLDAAGWERGADGIRSKDGRRLRLLFQSSTNAVRQDFQAIIKHWWQELGVETELKNIAPGVFFGGDAGSTDTFQRFYADVEMYAVNFDGTDPESFLAAYACDKVPGPENQWQGANVNRICDPAYDAMIEELARTADPVRRRELAVAMNNFVTIDHHFVIPLVDRGRISAHAKSLGGVALNTWDAELWNAADWYRIR